MCQAKYYAEEVKDKSKKDIDVSNWEHEFVEDLPEQQNGCVFLALTNLLLESSARYILCYQLQRKKAFPFTLSHLLKLTGMTVACL